MFEQRQASPEEQAAMRQAVIQNVVVFGVVVGLIRAGPKVVSFISESL